MTAEPVEKRRSAQLIALTGYLIGLPVESVVRVALHPPHSIEFKQVRGTLRMLAGHCALRAVEDGTEVEYRLEADLGISMITDDAARQFLVQFVERMIDRIKLAAERKTPARRLDDCLAELSATAIDVLKIDVEGVEKEVLQGAARALAITSNVLVEISPLRKGPHSRDHIEVLALLHDAGFTLMGQYVDYWFSKDPHVMQMFFGR